MKFAICITFLLSTNSIFAQDLSNNPSQDLSQKKTTASAQPLPVPLTLDFVLSTVDENHPAVQQAQAQVDYQMAVQDQVESDTGLNVLLQGEARYIEPPDIAFDQSNNDSQIKLVVQKDLLDFGRSNAASAAAADEVKGSEWLLKQAKNRHRINIMAAYFDVLLADLTFIRDNEAMATAYVQYDRMKQRNELGEHSDIDVLELEKDYQLARKNRYASRSLQRTTRARLANIMNRPGELVAEVAEPSLDYINQKLGDVDRFMQQALDDNPYLKAMRLRVQAAQNRVKSARAGVRPLLKGRLQVADYARVMGGYNDYEASLILDVPLWTGGTVQANIARETADLQRLKSQLQAQEMQVQQMVLETWESFNTLRVEREEVQSLTDYRDLYLDRSRALYEMEVKTDLGDSMVKISDARLRMARVKFKTALALAKLGALMGQPVFPFKELKVELPAGKESQTGKEPQTEQKSQSVEEPQQ
jgi:outer membrane protein TolC